MTALESLNNLATNSTKAKKETSKVPKVIVTPEQEKLIDEYISVQKSLKEQEVVLEQKAIEVKEIGLKEIETRCTSGDSTKSVILGDKVRVTMTDKFSVSAEEEELKRILNSHFDSVIEKEFSVELKKEIFQNEALLKELMNKLGTDFAKYFNTSFKLKTRKDFDTNKYKLPTNIRAEISKVVIQAKPSVVVL